jgi:Clathrin adaptor complex small chain
MSIQFLLVQTRTGKPRFSRFYNTALDPKKISRDVAVLLASRVKTTTFIEYSDELVLGFRRYAGLYFVVGLKGIDLLGLEFVQLYVEALDKYFGSVCELDLVFQFDKALMVLDEILIAGDVSEIDRTAISEKVKSWEILG